MGMIKHVVFAQQGRDWAPFQKMSNYVLLSSEDVNSSVCPDENPIITEYWWHRQRWRYRHNYCARHGKQNYCDINRAMELDFREVVNETKILGRYRTIFFRKFVGSWWWWISGFDPRLTKANKDNSETVLRISREEQSSAMRPTTILILSFAILTETVWKS